VSETILIRRLRRLAEFLDNDAAHCVDAFERTAQALRATDCRRAADRLEELTKGA
jgi:hypothetical protein